MIELITADLAPEQVYKLMTGTVTPRPIAWISTLNASGSVNLAPFSCYTFVAYDPPLVAVAIGGKRRFKDTLNNARRVGEFTVNAVTADLARPMVETSRKYPAEMSEADDLQIALEPGKLVSTPRVAAASISLECVVHRVVEIGDNISPSSADGARHMFPHFRVGLGRGPHRHGGVSGARSTWRAALCASRRYRTD